MSKEGDQIFDLSPKQKEIAEWRYKRRLELRNQYLKEVHSPKPNYAGHIFDPQVQRQYTANFAYDRIFVPKVKNFLWFVGLSFGVLGTSIYVVHLLRSERERRFRTGQVSYRDREWKFV